ncbi:Uncharacterised protein g9199 [Pycnogonum litorale]
MYDLFKLTRLLALPQNKNGEQISITCSAYAETPAYYICALSCSNGYVILYYNRNDQQYRPVVRQLPWLHHPFKLIKSLCFNPDGFWLIVVTEDASLYIVPALPLVSSRTQCEVIWNLNDVTKISIQGRRSPPTSVVWWQSIDNESIAIVGHELGEITFVNLKKLQEIACTCITVAVDTLHLIRNDNGGKTLLLITGVTTTQWFLLLEDTNSLFFWPGEADFYSHHNSVYDESPNYVCGGQNTETVSPLDIQPQQITKYEGISNLTPHCIHHHGRKSVLSVIGSPDDNLLTLHDWSLKDTPLSVHRLSHDTNQVLVTDNFLFCLSSGNHPTLSVLSRQLSEIQSSNDKIVDDGSSVLQTHKFPSKLRVRSMYKSTNYASHDVNENVPVDAPEFDVPSSRSRILSESYFEIGMQPLYEPNVRRNVSGSPSKSSIYSSSYSSSRSSQNTSTRSDHFEFNDESVITDPRKLDGCLIVTKYGLYSLRQRICPDELFLSLLSNVVPSNSNVPSATRDILPQFQSAERLAVALKLNTNSLYEQAAENQLKSGNLIEAVKFLQLSKCPLLKRVALLASQGCLGELLTYIDMLFMANISDILTPDRRHFANMVVHCFVHQLLNNNDKRCIREIFWNFLDGNIYYDDDVALKLLIKNGSYDSLLHLVKIHGLYQKMLEGLFAVKSECCYDDRTNEVLCQINCLPLFSRYNDDYYVQCVSMKQLGQVLLTDARIVSPYLHLIAELLPRIKDVAILVRITSVLDFTDPASKFFWQKLSVKYRKRCPSLTSLSTVSDTYDFVNVHVNEVNIVDLIEMFVSCILYINRLSPPSSTYDMNLMRNATYSVSSGESPVDCAQFVPFKPALLSCGAAHAGFIQNGSLYTWGKMQHGRLGHVISSFSNEMMIPKIVSFFMKLRIVVHSVSCGAHHTMAITSHGVYGWGSSFYGQLGLGDMLRTTQPVVIHDLLQQQISNGVNTHVVSIVCGQYHSIAVMSDGRLYTWGWGVHGQLGHGDPHNVSRPKLVDPRSVGGAVVQVAAGHSHSVVLNSQGDVYTFGCGLFGQLGLGTLRKQTSPHRVDLPEPVAHVSAGFFHSVALTSTNKLYTWGVNPQSLRLQAQVSRKTRGQRIQSGNTQQPTLLEMATSEKDTQTNHLVPKSIDTSLIDSRIKQLSCGAAHTALITTNGEVFTWGRNYDGQLGIGSRKEIRTPTMLIGINDKRMVDISCGSDFTIALDSSGRLWGWGRNDLGQLGIEQPEQAAAAAMSSKNTMNNKIVTIKNTKRMIHLKRSNHNVAEILKPVVLSWLPALSSIQRHNVQVDYNDSDPSNVCRDVQRSYSSSVMDIPCLNEMEVPPYGVKTLHTALQHLKLYYDPSAVLHQCLASHNYQAAAKVCYLEGALHKAVLYQLQGLEIGQSNVDNMAELVCHIVQFYVGHMEANNLRQTKSFIEYALNFWMKHSLPIDKLESLLTDNQDKLFGALAVTLFSSQDDEGNNELSKQSTGVDAEATNVDIVNLLSTKFCLSVVSHVVQLIESGDIGEEYTEHLVGTTTYKLLSSRQQTVARTSWEPSISSQNLWRAILGNLTKESDVESIVLPRSSVDSLHRNRVATETPSVFGLNDNDYVDGTFVAFTCGHHFTTHHYRTVVVPNLERSLHKLPVAIPKTKKMIVAMFEAEGFCPSACPRCVLATLQQIM